MSDRISVIVKFTAQDGQEGALRGALSTLIASSREETGNEYYDVYATDDPKVFIVHESWADKASLGAHTQTPRFLEFTKSMETVLAEPYGVTPIFEVPPQPA